MGNRQSTTASLSGSTSSRPPQPTLQHGQARIASASDCQGGRGQSLGPEGTPRPTPDQRDSAFRGEGETADSSRTALSSVAGIAGNVEVHTEVVKDKGKGRSTSPTPTPAPAPSPAPAPADPRTELGTSLRRPPSSVTNRSKRPHRVLSSLARQREIEEERKTRRSSIFRTFIRGPSSTSSTSPASTSPLSQSHSAMSRIDALRAYAQVKQPSAQIPPSTLLTHDNQTLAIFDAYPKAQYHFLILPRYPFHHQSDETRAFKSICKLEALGDLKSLMLQPGSEAREEVFMALKNMAREVEEMIKDEMMKTEGFTWGVDVGFHAIPSMK